MPCPPCWPLGANKVTASPVRISAAGLYRRSRWDESTRGAGPVYWPVVISAGPRPVCARRGGSARDRSDIHPGVRRTPPAEDAFLLQDAPGELARDGEADDAGADDRYLDPLHGRETYDFASRSV